MKLRTALALPLSVATLAGCTVIGPIVPAAQPSGFEGAVYSGAITSINTPKTAAQYRVFTQGASSFVPLQAVLEDSQARAVRFCEQKDSRYRTLSETVSKPPHILGNFPRAEIVFECVEK